MFALAKHLLLAPPPALGGDEHPSALSREQTQACAEARGRTQTSEEQGAVGPGEGLDVRSAASTVRRRHAPRRRQTKSPRDRAQLYEVHVVTATYDSGARKACWRSLYRVAQKTCGRNVLDQTSTLSLRAVLDLA